MYLILSRYCTGMFVLCIFAFVSPAALVQRLPATSAALIRRLPVTYSAGRRAGSINSLESTATLQFRQLTPSQPDLPLLLFLPGIDGSGLAGTTQWPRLGSTFEIRALSLSADDRSTFDALCSHCSAFLATAAKGRGCLLVGESTGAVVALGVALRSPSLIDGMCLINPATSYSGSALSVVAPLLPRLPQALYRTTPLLVTPLFGKPDWFRPIVGERAPAMPAPLLPTPADVLAASSALAEVLPADTLAWRLREHLEVGSASVNSRLRALEGRRALAAGTLLLGAERDLLLPSVDETRRLQVRLPGSKCKAIAGAAHACLDDGRRLNLRLELDLAGVSATVLSADRARRAAARTEANGEAGDEANGTAGTSTEAAVDGVAEGPLAVNGSVHSVAEGPLERSVDGDGQSATASAGRPSGRPPATPLASSAGAAAVAAEAVDPAPASPFESWLQSMRRLFSPLYYATRADGGLEAGLGGLQQRLPAEGTPILFVGNHQLYGFDGPLLVEEMLRETGRLMRPLVFPPLMAETSPLAPFPYPLPGTASTFERFGATPISARAMFGALQRGESVLLFPGGAREVFKRKGEAYQLFWPDDANLVRLAARHNATIVPFSGLGGDESFTMALDTSELLRLPLVGDFFRERVEPLPSLVPDDFFVPPFGYISPQRHYFLFGTPIDTTPIDPADRDECARAYAGLKGQVVEGVRRLDEDVRAADPYRELVPRTAWEALYDAQAPGPPGLL